MEWYGSSRAQTAMTVTAARLLLYSLVLLLFKTEVGALSRPKRYLVFPEGSTFSFAFCMTIKGITPDVDIFTEAVAVAVSYDLPHNASMLGLHQSVTARQRSHRSYVYTKMETILNRLGLAGEACILRAICEGGRQLPQGRGLLAELLRILLMFPEEVAGAEREDDLGYLRARRAGLDNSNCAQLYNSCPLSLVELLSSLAPVTGSAI